MWWIDLFAWLSIAFFALAALTLAYSVDALKKNRDSFMAMIAPLVVVPALIVGATFGLCWIANVS